MLDLRSLAALRAVHSAGSVAAAARALGWSQPTVAHHLHSLDRLLGAATTASAASGTVLTPTGSALLPHARAILDRADRAVAEVRETRGARAAALTLGVFPSAGARLMPPVVRELQGRGYAVTVREQELYHLLGSVAALAVDAAIVYDHPVQPTEVPEHSGIRPLFTEPLALVVPRAHRLAGRRRVRLVELASEAWVFGTDESDPVDLALRVAARRAGFTPAAAPVSSDDYAVITGYVEAGLGVALVPRTLLPPHPEAVAVVELEQPGLARHVELVASSYLAPGLADTLAELVTARARELLGGSSS
ncbi:MAG TPA: LysR substrate-binding domain-containing protein [Gryllotalpicola sp.]